MSIFSSDLVDEFRTDHPKHLSGHSGISLNAHCATQRYLIAELGTNRKGRSQISLEATPPAGKPRAWTISAPLALT